MMTWIKTQLDPESKYYFKQMFNLSSQLPKDHRLEEKESYAGSGNTQIPTSTSKSFKVRLG